MSELQDGPISDAEADRRKFLLSAGRFAVAVPPSMTLLLSTTLSSPAIAASGGSPINSGGNAGGGNAGGSPFGGNDGGGNPFGGTGNTPSGGLATPNGGAIPPAQNAAAPAGQSSVLAGGPGDVPQVSLPDASLADPASADMVAGTSNVLSAPDYVSPSIADKILAAGERG